MCVYSYNLWVSDMQFFLPSFCRVIKVIFDEVDGLIESGKLIQELNMDALPVLCNQFAKLVKYLVRALDLTRNFFYWNLYIFY